MRINQRVEGSMIDKFICYTDEFLRNSIQLLVLNDFVFYTNSNVKVPN